MPKQEFKFMFKCAILMLFSLVGLQSISLAQHQNVGEASTLKSVVEAFKTQRLSKVETLQEVKKMLFSKPTGQSILKCANPLFHELHIEAEELFTTTTSSLNKSNKSASVSEIYMSPSGRFSIDFRRTGSDSVRSTDLNTNGIPDYVERTALELDFTWNKQVQELGFKDPLLTISPFPIELRNIGSQVYGYTSNNGRKVVIHSTFSGFPTNTDPDGIVIGALKATIAHEMKHAIQYRYNQLSGESYSWVEMDATLHEEVVYDEVNDYYNYLSSSDSYFKNSGNNSAKGSYEDVSFALFFHEKYGSLFWTAVWNRIPTETTNFRQALSLELISRGSTLEVEMNEIALWHLFSGGRARSGFGFSEAAFYPNLRLQTTLLGSLSQIQEVQNVSPFSFQVVAITSNNASGYVNTGLFYDGVNQPFTISSKLSVANRVIQLPDGSQVYIDKTEENWNTGDTLFYVLGNGSRTESINYRVFNSTGSSNSGFALWGDVDESGIVNQLDAIAVLQSVISETPLNGLAGMVGDLTNDGTTSTYDAAKLLEVINGKKALFEIDKNKNGKAPENLFFRPNSTTTSTTQSDSLMISIEPLNAVSEDAHIQLLLNYQNDSYAQGLHFTIAFDSTNMSLLDAKLDDFITGSVFFYEVDESIHLVIASDSPLPPGPFLSLRFNRKNTSITQTQFKIEQIQVNEYESIPIRTNTLITPIPTKLGVSIGDEFVETTHPTSLTLYPAFPNPFNPSTTVKFSNPSLQKVSIQVYNVLGQLVKTLLNREMQSGIHQVVFDAQGLASGVYIIQIQTNEAQRIQKISLMK